MDCTFLHNRWLNGQGIKILCISFAYFLLVGSCKKEIEIKVYRNKYEEALRQAESEGKKLFIYFDVISLPKPYLEKFLKNRKLRQALADDYIVVRLQCDKGLKFGVDTIDHGAKNLNIERELTGRNYQPLYYIKDKKVEKFIGHCTLEELIEFVE
ncbi:MAG TPA: hypothetical protein PK006_09920 [Saprospiraceae bacterium]|nr:hypothetical protein [Saprospiraceae bacterium]